MSEGLEIRTMGKSDLETVLGWAAEEGWNPGEFDGETYLAADPGGFFVGLLDGEPIASISAVRYGDSFGFIGLYIVRPEYRGRGYGMSLWRAGLDNLGERVAGLDGVVERQDDYRRSGFDLAFRNVRFSGPAGGTAPIDSVVPLTQIPFEELSRYDSQLFPAPRPAFLRPWARQQGSRGFAAVRDGALAGYGMVRPSRGGHRIGPLFADDDGIAEDLFQALAASVPAGEALFIDLPEPNGQALALAQRHGMSQVFETARMYKGRAPVLPLDRIFGVTTLELG